MGKPTTSVCDPVDLYPLAKVANEVADNVVSNSKFLTMLGDDMSSLLLMGGSSSWRRREEGEKKTTTTATATRSFLSARLLSSWTIETQLYGDTINYLGPLAFTPLFLTLNFLHETCILIALSWIGLCFLRSIRLCRVCAIRIVKKYWNPNYYNPLSQDDDDDDNADTDNNNDYEDRDHVGIDNIENYHDSATSASASGNRNRNKDIDHSFKSSTSIIKEVE